MATLTRIFGFLYDSAGNVVTTGTVTMQLQQDMVSVDGTKVAPFTITQDLSTSAGFFEKYVYATVGASPAGLAYYVEFDPTPSDTTKPASQKDGYWRNYWAVPNTSAVPIGNFVSAHRGEPLSNYMPLGGTFSNPNFDDNITLGLTPTSSSKSVIANQTVGSNPTVRYNATSSYWDLTNDGTTYRRIVTGTGTTDKLTKWSAAGVLADSIISESGTTATIADTLKVSTITTPTATDLTLSPTGNLVAAKDVLPNVARTRNLGAATNKFLSIYAEELRINTIVAQENMSTVGGRLTVGETTTLTANLAAGATLASLKHNFPAKDDIFYIEVAGVSEYLKIFPWDIVAVDTTAEWFEIAGDYTTSFTAGRTFVVRGSSGALNDGTWTVSSSAYQGGTVRTRITVTGNITNNVAVGHIAYLDAGPYVYRLSRNLEGGSDSWSAGDALLKTSVFIDMHASSGIAAGTGGPTIVGKVRTGTTYNTGIKERWVLGDLNGYYGYSSTTYGVAFGDPTSSWVKIDSTNGVRMGNNTTTNLQIATSGVATFSAGGCIINQNGISIDIGDGERAVNSTYQFHTTATHTVSGLVGLSAYATTDEIQDISIWNYYSGPSSPGVNYQIQLQAIYAPGGTIDQSAFIAIRAGRTSLSTPTNEVVVAATNIQMQGKVNIQGGDALNGGLIVINSAGPGATIFTSKVTSTDVFLVSHLTAGNILNVKYETTGYHRADLFGELALNIPGASTAQNFHVQRIPGDEHQSMIGHNLRYVAGSGYYRDDTSYSGWMIRLQGSVDGDFIRFDRVGALAGVNPATPVTKAYVDGSGNVVATSAFISATNGAGFYCRNAAGSSDLQILTVDGSNFTTLVMNSAKLRFAGGVVSAAALGAYAGKINVFVDGIATSLWLPVYS